MLCATTCKVLVIYETEVRRHKRNCVHHNLLLLCKSKKICPTTIHRREIL